MKCTLLIYNTVQQSFYERALINLLVVSLPSFRQVQVIAVIK